MEEAVLLPVLGPVEGHVKRAGVGQMVAVFPVVRACLESIFFFCIGFSTDDSDTFSACWVILAFP